MKLCCRIILMIMACGICHKAKAQIISFADNSVKELCVNKWDVNGDGELSQQEAATVTSLGTIFRGNKIIKTFEELCYFSGLQKVDEYAFYESSLQKVGFPSGVKEIGNYAFYNTQLGEELIIPGTVKTIGASAFANCRQLRRIILGDGVEHISAESFTGEIHFMSLPSTINFFAAEGINPYIAEGLVVRDYVFRMMVRSREPIPVRNYAFRRLFGEGILIVPFGARNNYEGKANWTNFYKIVEVGDVNEDGDINVKDVVAVSSYIMDNNPWPFNKDIADTNGDGEINVKDVVGISNYIMQK